jgi:thioredoxin reductase (NADPH)
MKDQRFTELNTRQVKVLKEFGAVENYKERTQVFELGEKEYDFFVVLEGEVLIEDPYNDGAVIVAYERFEFSGDSGMFLPVEHNSMRLPVPEPA